VLVVVFTKSTVEGMPAQTVYARSNCIPVHDVVRVERNANKQLDGKIDAVRLFGPDCQS
jgi:succinyl-CoA synthetase alpha subunit